ncbi:MAG: hypothetical protein ACFHVJ_14410 [Aestuariibacter sp.]
MNALLTLFALGILALMPAAMAKTSVVVSEIPSLLNHKVAQPAAYNHLLNSLQEIEVIFVPPARVEVEFRSKNANCLFPGSVKSMPGGDQLLQSDPVQKVQAFIFTMRPYSNINQLNESVLGIRRGFTFGSFRERFSGNFVDLPNDVTAFTMLHKERLDGVVAYLPDALAAQHQIKMSPRAFYLQEQVIYEAPDAFVCHPEHVGFVDYINIKIQQWKSSGQLQKWFANAVN